MARKKPAKKAKVKSASRTAKRKAAPRKAARRVAKASKQVAKKAAKKKAAPKKRAAQRSASAKAPTSAKATAGGPARPAAKKSAAAGKRPNLDRPRKTVADIHGLPSSLDMGRSASAVKTGRAELKERLSKNTSASPALTAGDIDADWESAETVGDEAPGGDNPTPDQDVVDEIGRALGVEYEDDEELQGGAEIADRDRHRWELDPSSKDDFDEDKE